MDPGPCSCVQLRLCVLWPRPRRRSVFLPGPRVPGPRTNAADPRRPPRAGRLTPALALICDIYVLTIHAVPAASLTGFFQPRPAPAGLLGRPDLVQAECPRPAPPVVTAPPPWPALIWAQGGSTLGQALSVCLSVPRRLVARSPSGQRVPCSKVLTLLTLHSPLQDTRLSYGHSFHDLHKEEAKTKTLMRHRSCAGVFERAGPWGPLGAGELFRVCGRGQRQRALPGCSESECRCWLEAGSRGPGRVLPPLPAWRPAGPPCSAPRSWSPRGRSPPAEATHSSRALVLKP